MSWEVEFRKQAKMDAAVPVLSEIAKNHLYLLVLERFWPNKANRNTHLTMTLEEYELFCEHEGLVCKHSKPTAGSVRIAKEESEGWLSLCAKLAHADERYRNEAEEIRKREEARREAAQRAEDHRLWLERMSLAVGDWKIFVGVEELFDESVYTVTRTKIRHTEVFLPGAFCDLFDSLDDVLDTAVTAAGDMDTVYCLLVIVLFASRYRGRYRGRLYGSATTWNPGGCACILRCLSDGVLFGEICIGLTLALPLSHDSERV